KPKKATRNDSKEPEKNDTRRLHPIPEKTVSTYVSTTLTQTKKQLYMTLRP
ncbi:13009_t:CDS:1, partial [Gigaspora rosea]